MVSDAASFELSWLSSVKAGLLSLYFLVCLRGVVCRGF